MTPNNATLPAKTATLLVVDDTPENLEVLSRVLAGEYRVKAANSGARALRICSQDPLPDLILLDVMMGTLDEGFQVAYRLRSEPLTAETPIIMLSAVGERTGFAFDKDKDANFLPVNEFIEKPISPRKLVDLVRRHLPTTN